MADVLLLGAGGHARALVAALTMSGVDIRGYLAPVRSEGFADLDWLGSDEKLADFDPADVEVVNALGSTKSLGLRRKLYDQATSKGFTVASVIHPRAFIDPSAVLGTGVQILVGAIINAGTRVGSNSIINSGAIVEHDTVVGDHSHIAPGAVLGGSVVVGSECHVGLGSRVIQEVEIGSGGVVGAGAVVLHDVAPHTTVVGVPAHPIPGK